MRLSVPWMNTGACQVNERASIGRAATLAAWCTERGSSTRQRSKGAYLEWTVPDVEAGLDTLEPEALAVPAPLTHLCGTVIAVILCGVKEHDQDKVWKVKWFRSQLNKRGHFQQWDGPKPPRSHLMVPCCQVLRNSRAATLWNAVEGFRYWGTPQ